MNQGRTRLRVAALIAAAVFGIPAWANATIVWDWSFGGESGNFVTDGSESGGAVAPGIYTLEEFTVTSSVEGMPVGSDTGGQYTDGGFDTGGPYSFDWSGSAVADWEHASGANPGHWWVMDSNTDSDLYYFFGWLPPNDLNPGYAAVHEGFGDETPEWGLLTVEVAGEVPEPGNWGIMLAGSALSGAVLRRGRRNRSIALG